jgi:DNA-binding SARP family transcriptional activator
VVSRLSLHLLGPPHIEHNGELIKVDTRKAIALLAYIAVTGESHRRASIINLLWPEYERTRGRTVLRRTLYALRKALPGPYLYVDQEEIGLDPGADIWVDVQTFHQHLAACKIHGHPASQVCPACVAPLTDAVVLYRGDFLAGFGLKDSINFDAWQLSQAEVLRRELAGALERLELWHCSQRELETAIGYGRRRLALDPFDESAYQKVMQLYAWSGQHAAALLLYEELHRVLQDQLGIPPQRSTTELFEAIKEGRAPPSPILGQPYPVETGRGDDVISIPARPSALFAQLPTFLDKGKEVERPIFVARERELTQLDGFLNMALSGQGVVVFITGEAGSGKTALVQEFALNAQALHPDLVVACGHGNAHTGIGDPYLPFREILELLTGDVKAQWAAGAMTRDQARRLWHLLPLAVQALMEAGPDLIDLFVPSVALVKRAASIAPVGSGWLAQLEELVARKAAAPVLPNLQQSAIFEQYTQVLRLLANQKPLLLVLDDLQWADGGSINLLFHLGRQITGNRILIVGAYRPAEVALGRPASPLLAGLTPSEAEGKLEGDRERHPLAPVVNEFKTYYGDIMVDLERADGRQFVDAFLDSEPNQLSDAFRGTLFQHTKGVPLFTIELLRGMQERGDLTPDAEGYWVEGPALDWERLPVRVEAVIAERIDRLPKRLRDVLTVASVEGETFTAEVIAGIETGDEEQMVRCLSDTLDRKYRLVSARGIVRIGSQRLSQYRFRHILFQKYLYNSLDPVKRVHLHQAVGTALKRLYGGRAAEAAVQLAHHFQEAGIAEEAVEYLRQAGERAQRLYANEEAIGYFRRALLLLEDIPLEEVDTKWRAEIATRLHENLGDVLEWIGEHAKATDAYQRALGYVPECDPIWKSHLHRKAGNIWRLQHRYEEASLAYDLAETALAVAAIKSTPEWWQEWVQIQLERMWMYYWLGQWRKISELADQVRPVVERHGTPTQRINFFLSLSSMYFKRDRSVATQETIALCQTALTISQESGNPSEIAWAGFMLGFYQLWFGDLEAAEKQLGTALNLAEQTGDVVHQSRCLTYLTILYRKHGQIEKVRQYISRSLEAAEMGQMMEYLGMAKANRAWVAWREGDLARAQEFGQTALELWEQLPAGHSSRAFQWTVFWPLLGVALAQDQASQANRLACALLDHTQQRLPDSLETVVKKGMTAWEEGQAETAVVYLHQAIELAQELGYL